ncbi:hypothetical protein ASE14_02190 [Agromyces sp. Root81]|nr:hypothetical protein ASE14_02190 [Agromyces sp. Root81]
MLPEELDWLHLASRNVNAAEIRLSLPIMSRAGELVVDGWTASPVLEGEHRAGKWTEIARVAFEFADQFRGVDRPAFLDERTHAWSRADRLAWGEREPADIDGAPFLADLLAARLAISEPPGIVHGDLSGNVLFDEMHVPSVIDLTLYWRPVKYSVAIVAVDGACFEGAPVSLLETIEPSEHFSQYLVRALIFRIATDWFNKLTASQLTIYEDVSRRVLELVSADGRIRHE